MRILVMIAAVAILSARPVLAEDGAGPASCRASPQRTGDCFTVHGRMTSCTGVPNLRIWIVGTRRVLGVTDAAGNPAGDHIVPPKLDQSLSADGPCGKAAYGDFTVCPLTPDRPGVMRRVCLVEAGRLVVTDF